METRKNDSGVGDVTSTNRVKKLWGYFAGGKVAGAER